MAELQHTLRGATNLPLLVRNWIVVYVEGDDDRAFWRCLFPVARNDRTIRFTPVGGKDRLLEIAKAVMASSNAIIAIDSDYDEITRTLPRHPCIVKTIRYSIENHVFDEQVIKKVADVQITECRDDLTVDLGSLRACEEILQRMVILDCYFREVVAGDGIFPKSAAQVMPTNDVKIDSSQLKTICDQKANGIEMAAVKTIEAEVKRFDVLHLVPGHFLTYYVRRIVAEVAEKSGKHYRISDNQMMKQFVLAFENVKSNLSHTRKIVRSINYALRVVINNDARPGLKVMGARSG